MKRIRFPQAIHARLRAAAAAFCFLLLAVPVQAALRCDVFVGFDGIVSEGCWAPISFEVENDGPGFTATILVSGSSAGDQSRSIVLELPTGTTKRFSVPVFISARSSFAMNWDVRVLDEQRRVRYEQGGLRPNRSVADRIPLLGALTRTVAGVPSLPKRAQPQSDQNPASARLQPNLFPDNPILLESLTAIYLNTETASRLKPAQASALLAWLHGGGHLIIGIEEPGDFAGAPWLRAVSPFEASTLQSIPLNGQFRDWVNAVQRRGGIEQNTPAARGTTPRGRVGGTPVQPSGVVPLLSGDAAFDTATLLAVTGTPHGDVLIRAGDTPLVVDGVAGRGRVTALCFSPEREPFKSWRNSPEFWAALLGVELTPPSGPDNMYYSSTSTDGIWGVLVETKQVHKLPIVWLLVILVGYLAVIGPLDQIVLKRMNRQMLTWITFPLYVLGFSLLIYFIGYKLRAGESEWNELNVVDVLPAGDRAQLRGRTYASVYSPANQRYELAGGTRYAAVRNELRGLGYGSSGDSESLEVQQNNDAFRASAFVPVWSSRLFVGDWWQSGEVPLSASFTRSGTTLTLTLQNRLTQPLRGLRVAVGNRLWEVGGEAPAGQTATFTLEPGAARTLSDTVNQMAGTFHSAVTERQGAFGSNRELLPDPRAAAVGASLIGSMLRPSQPGQPTAYNPYQAGQQFNDPGKVDLLGLLDDGQAIIFAWVDDYSPVTSMNQFKPLRSRRDTLLRLAVPVNP